MTLMHGARANITEAIGNTPIVQTQQGRRSRKAARFTSSAST
jgi:hypothetical protein